MSGVIRRERCTPFYSRKGRGIKRGILSMYYLWIIFDFLKYLFFNVEWRLCEKEYFMKKSKPLPSNNFHPPKKERYNFETMVKISTPEKYKPPFSKLETGREKKRVSAVIIFQSTLWAHTNACKICKRGSRKRVLSFPNNAIYYLSRLIFLIFSRIVVECRE